MKIIKTAKYKKTAQEKGYFYPAIAEFIQDIDKNLPRELEKIKAYAEEIRNLETQVLAMSKTQTGVSEGQDYYGKDYFSQSLASKQELTQNLNNIDDQDIWNIAPILQSYVGTLKSMIRDLKWDQRDQNDPSISQNKAFFTGQ